MNAHEARICVGHAELERTRERQAKAREEIEQAASALKYTREVILPRELDRVDAGIRTACGKLLRVFCYRTEDGDLAELLRLELVDRGFDVTPSNHRVEKYAGSADDNYAYAREAHTEYALQITW